MSDHDDDRKSGERTNLLSEDNDSNDITTDLDGFFDKHSHLSNDLKVKLVSSGLTLDKLLIMENEQILLFASADKSMLADLILLTAALKQHKQNMNNYEMIELETKVPQSQDSLLPTNNDANLISERINILSTHHPSIETETEITNIEYNSLKISKNTNEYNLCDIISSIKNDDKNYYNFILVWLIMFGLTLCILIYIFIDLHYECDASCDIDNSYYGQCKCGYYGTYDGDGYQTNKCGNDSNDDYVYCQLSSNLIPKLIMIIISIIDFLLIIFYFIYKYKINILNSFIYAICFIPLSILIFIFVFISGIALFGLISPILFYSNCKHAPIKNKKLYSDNKNNITHLHVINTIIFNKDYRFICVWIFMLTYTIIGIIYCINSYYQFICQYSHWDLQVQIAVCYSKDDIGNRCGNDSYDHQVYCQRNNNYSVISKPLIAIIILFNYLFIVFGFKKICNMPITKAMVLGFPMLCMMFGFSIPLAIIGGMVTAIAMSVFDQNQRNVAFKFFRPMIEKCNVFSNNDTEM